MKLVRNTPASRSLVEALEGRRLLSAGTLDPSFGYKGTVQHAVPGNANSAAVQTDGKIIVVGANGEVSRFNADGSFDTSFGPNGTGKESLSLNANFTAVTILPDGKIDIAGYTLSHSFNAIVVRLLPNGSLDSSFTLGGFDVIPPTDFTPYAIAVQQNGEIIVAGTIYEGHVFPGFDFCIARLYANGYLDQSFGDGGVTTVDIGDVYLGDMDVISAVAIDYNGNANTNSDFGKIVAVGESDGGSGDDPRFAVARFNTNGKLDTSFAGDGHLVTTFPGHAEALATGVVIQAGGKVVVGGYVGGSYETTDHNFALARYLSNGSLDKSFGSAGTGLVDTDLGDTDDRANSLISGFSQKLILGGSSNGEFALAAYTPNGVLDKDFNGTGFVKTPFSNAPDSSIVSLALSPNRTIIAVGNGSNLETVGSGSNLVGLARYFDVGPDVLISSFDSVAHESGQVPAKFFVFRDVALPFATRVYFNITGTASPTKDYSGVTIQQPVIGPTSSLDSSNTARTKTIHPGLLLIGYVDIPANQQFATVTITPIDHGTASPNKTAIFSLLSNALYDTTAPTSVTLLIVGDASQSTTVKASADAYVQDGSAANTNFGTSPSLVVKNGTTGLNRETYLTFNLSNISTVNSVQLQLFGNLTEADGSGVVTQVFSVANTGWSETGITFNNKPAAGATMLSSVSILNTTQQTYTLDVTAYVKAQLAAGHKIVSFVLKDPIASNAAIIFNSREAGGNQPALLIG